MKTEEQRSANNSVLVISFMSNQDIGIVETMALSDLWNDSLRSFLKEVLSNDEGIIVCNPEILEGYVEDIMDTPSELIRIRVFSKRGVVLMISLF